MGVDEPLTVGCESRNILCCTCTVSQAELGEISQQVRCEANWLLRNSWLLRDACHLAERLTVTACVCVRGIVLGAPVEDAHLDRSFSATIDLGVGVWGTLAITRCEPQSYTFGAVWRCSIYFNRAIYNDPIPPPLPRDASFGSLNLSTG